MAEYEVKRKLTTILAADVVGYTRLMRADEEATLKTLGEYRDVIDGLIARHEGRVFSTGGDSVLAEFGSVVEAVRCAISCQEEISSRNAELADDRKLIFRMGVNVGDVMIRDGDLFGDGVNVAARLEGLAEAGGVCISGSVFEQIKHKLSLGFEDMGQQQVKNIADPVTAYRLVPRQVSVSVDATAATKPSDGKRWRLPVMAVAVALIFAAGGFAIWRPWEPVVEPASLDRMAFPLPDKPSIAVLPFVNLSGDATQDYLGDGIAENIITALSRVAEMFVIARTSTFTYKGKVVKVQQVAEDLGVRYVLEGSVQRSGDKVRVTAQLIDALEGHHIWAERYEREFKDAFALQDEITLNVLTALEVKLTAGAGASILRGNTKNLDAYQLLRRGERHFLRFTNEDNTKAQRLFQQAVELDPNYTQGWYFIGLTHQLSAKFGWSDDAVQEQVRAEELARKALSIDPSDPGAYNLLANIALHRRQYDEALGYNEKAVALAQNSAGTLALLGRTLVYAERPEEALLVIQKAIRLSPFSPPNVLRYEGIAYHSMGRYEEAIAAFERARTRNPNSPLPLVWLAITYADKGQMEQARAAAQEILELNRNFSTKVYVNATMDYKDRTKTGHAIATLRQLGLPE